MSIRLAPPLTRLARRTTWPFEDSNTVTDTPTPPETTVANPTPPPPANTATLTVGFLTVLSDAGGVLCCHNLN